MKKNFFEEILAIFAPDKCYFCRRLGEVVCDECLKELKFENPSKNSREFYLTNRGESVEAEALSQLVEDLKFKSRRRNAKFLARIMADNLRDKFDFTDENLKFAITPAPSSPRRIRERGLAHAELIAKLLAQELGAEYAPIIARRGNHRQLGSSAEKRHQQAREAYYLCQNPSPDTIYLVLDDIKTTGATLDAISQILRSNGANEVYQVYFLRQK